MDSLAHRFSSNKWPIMMQAQRRVKNTHIAVTVLVLKMESCSGNWDCMDSRAAIFGFLLQLNWWAFTWSVLRVGENMVGEREFGPWKKEWSFDNLWGLCCVAGFGFEFKTRSGPEKNGGKNGSWWWDLDRLQRNLFSAAAVCQVSLRVCLSFFVLFSLSSPHWLIGWDQFWVFRRGFLKKALLLKREINDSHMKLVCPFSWRLINLHSLVCY